MKNTIKSIIVMSAIAASLSSCSTTVPYEITNNPVGTKVGKSSTNTIFGFLGYSLISGQYSRFSSVGWRFNKQYSLYNAAKNGGISKIATVDLKTTSYILFSKYELIVTGE